MVHVSDAHSCEELNSKSHKYALQNFPEVCQTEEFLMLPLEKVGKGDCWGKEKISFFISYFFHFSFHIFFHFHFIFFFIFISFFQNFLNAYSFTARIRYIHMTANVGSAPGKGRQRGTAERPTKRKTIRCLRIIGRTFKKTTQKLK